VRTEIAIRLRLVPSDLGDPMRTYQPLEYSKYWSWGTVGMDHMTRKVLI